MPDQDTIDRARQDAAEGKSPSTQAGEFVREEMHHVREGVHGARSTKQAIAIGLSKARRAGVELPPPPAGKSSTQARRKASQDSSKARSQHRPSRKRSQATLKALQREGRTAASHNALSDQARTSANKRGAEARHRSSMKAVRTRKIEGVRKTAKTRARRGSR